MIRLVNLLHSCYNLIANDIMLSLIQCQETLVQYGSFLALNMSIEDYINNLVPLNSLMNEYHLSPDIAFYLIRPMVVHNILVRHQSMIQSILK